MPTNVGEPEGRDAPPPRGVNNNAPPLTYEQEVHALLTSGKVYAADLAGIFERDAKNLHKDERHMALLTAKGIRDVEARFAALIPEALARRDAPPPNEAELDSLAVMYSTYRELPQADASLVRAFAKWLTLRSDREPTYAELSVRLRGSSQAGSAPGWPDDSMLEAAWGLIANANEGDWSKAHPEWRAAAEHWRDAYHCTLRGAGNAGSPDTAIRKLLWLRHGCPIGALYGDDGEMSCGACGIDFLRWSAEQIEQRFTVRGAASPSSGEPT